MIETISHPPSPARNHPTGTFARICFSLILLSIAVVLNGCGQGGNAVERGNRDQVLHINLGSDPAGLDPHMVTTIAEFDVLRAILEGLVSEDARDLSPVPGVAERWEISADGLTYTFFLRENARWSNGDAVTAEDFIFSYQRVLSPALGARYATMLYPVDNARAFHEGEIDAFSEVGFEAVNERTLRIRLENPTPHFLSLLTNPCWYPVHPPNVLRHGRIDQQGTPWTRAEHFVGNGPFALADWRTGRGIRVDRNPHYWDAENVRLNAIHFHPIESPDTEERAFRSGQLHVTKEVPPDRITYYQQNFPDLVRSEPYLAVYFFRLNLREEILRDVRVRRALSLAIDQEAIVRNVLHGHADPAFSFTPPNTAGYTPRARIGFDVEEARGLLAEAGYPNGEGFPAIDLLFNTQEVHRRIAEAVQQMLRTHLNIQVNLYNQEHQSFMAAVQAGNYQVSRGAWTGDYLAPSTFLGIWISTSGNNRTGWANAEYDALIEKAARATDQAERLEIFQQAEALLLEESPMIPIYHYRKNYLIQPSVRGWHGNILDRHPFQHLYLEDPNQN